MVRRKGRSHGAVLSLFAFQDIITATTGIIILFILALALLIAEEAPPNVVELTETTTEVLNEQLHKVKQQVSELKLELERSELFSKETTMTEKEFKARLKYVANAKKTVEKEKAAITAQVEILSAAQKELLEDDEKFQRSLEEIEQAVEALTARENLLENTDFRSNLREQLATLNQQIEMLKSAIDKANGVEVKVVEYRFTEFDEKEVWVVHIRGDRCTLIPYNSPNSAETKRHNGDDAIIVDWLTDKISQHNATNGEVYVYLAIAPSGVSIFRKVQLMLENKRDLDYGFDLLPNNQTELK